MKIRITQTLTGKIPLIKGEVLQATVPEQYLPAGWLSVSRKSETRMLNPTEVEKYTEKVPDSTPLNVIEQPIEIGIIPNMPLILSLVGGIGGLVYANKKGCGVWGYVGYFVVGNIIGGGSGTVIKIVATGKQ